MLPENYQEKTLATYKNTAQSYTDRLFKVTWIEHLADVFIEKLAGKKILEVGCGPGRDAKYFIDKGFDVTATDITDEFITIAQENVPKATVLQMDMTELTFPDMSFDGLWSAASFLHIPKADASATLQGFNRVLKPGGILYLGMKAGEGEKMVSKEAYLGGEKFFSFYTEEELTQLVEQEGFTVINTVIEEKKEITWINLFARKN